jgi:hypothetical protein
VRYAGRGSTPRRSPPAPPAAELRKTLQFDEGDAEAEASRTPVRGTPAAAAATRAAAAASSSSRRRSAARRSVSETPQTPYEDEEVSFGPRNTLGSPLVAV